MSSQRVAYTTIESPIGELFLAATGTGVVRIAFETASWDSVLAELKRKVGSPQEDPRALAGAITELNEYFAGERREFTVAIDMQLAHGFRHTALNRLREIPYGETESYAEVAEAAGSPRAMRAVGSACANNPIPLIIPCHRVVRSDGSLGGYGGGLHIKEDLLALERKALAA